MDWAKKNYDSLILAACTALLAFAAAHFYFQSEGFLSSIPTATTVKPSLSIATAEETESLARARLMIEKPVLWNEKSLVDHEQKERGNLFVSRLYILKDGNLIDPIEGQQQLHPPITNAWLIKFFGLNNFADATIKDQDSDQDGFTNLEEFNDQSDPKDKASHPPKINKLRFVKFEQIDFPVIFKGDAGIDGIELQFGKVKFTPSRTTGSSDPEVVLGSIDLNGIKYNVRSYRKKEYPTSLPSADKNKYDEILRIVSENIKKDENLKTIETDTNDARKKLKLSEDAFSEIQKSKSKKDSLKKASEEVEDSKKQITELLNFHNQAIKAIWRSVDPSFEQYWDSPKKDLSEVNLTNTLTHENITLVKGIPTPDPNSIGEFYDSINNETLRCKKGQEITMKSDVNTKLKLIDIFSTEARIQDIATGTIYTLPKSSSPAPRTP
jgi:hypothetical protein